MSERSVRLFWALSDIDEQKIDEAFPENRTNRWKKWGVLAAALVLVMGVGSYMLPRMGGSSGNGGASSPGGGGGAGTNEASTFMSYAGPVFPLTLREADSAVTADREITLDFTDWMSAKYNGFHGRATDILVTDAYTLTNTSAEEKTVGLLYPFSGALYRLSDCTPVLTADGAKLDAVLHAGGYTGGFQSPYGGGAEEPLLNLDQINSWEEYKALLSDGRYQAAALEGYPDLSGVPVTVYRFFDYYGPEPDEKAGHPNPSIRAGFDLDYDKTTVLSYGFHAGSYDRENGTMIQGFSIPRPFQDWYGDPYYLFVLGDDIRNLTTGAYVTGGTDADTETLDDAGVSVERYVSDLESALHAAALLMYSRSEKLQESGTDFELYYGLLKEFISSYGILSNEPVDRYDTGWLTDMDVTIVDRVFYLETEVDIPAGGSVRLTAELAKEGSYDFYCAHTENQGVYGYDMVTELGSNLICTEQTAVLEDRGQIEIVRQNFGFDPENGVTRVTLDPQQEHYYLEVKGREGRFERQE